MSSKLLTFKTKILERSSTLEERTALFHSIYTNNKQYVRKTLYWVVGPDLVDDAVQDTFINIWRKIHKFENRADIKTWIRRVAINSGISVLRKNKKHQNNKDLNDENFLEETTSSDYLLKRLIENAVLSLDEKFRVVFVLYYKQELSVNEISKTLSIPEGTVKSRLHSGRDTFKFYLEKHGVDYESR